MSPDYISHIVTWHSGIGTRLRWVNVFVMTTVGPRGPIHQHCGHIQSLTGCTLLVTVRKSSSPYTRPALVDWTLLTGSCILEMLLLWSAEWALSKMPPLIYTPRNEQRPLITKSTLYSPIYVHLTFPIHNLTKGALTVPWHHEGRHLIFYICTHVIYSP